MAGLCLYSYFSCCTKGDEDSLSNSPPYMTYQSKRRNSKSSAYETFEDSNPTLSFSRKYEGYEPLGSVDLIRNRLMEILDYSGISNHDCIDQIHREFVSVKPGEKEDGSLRVMQYNILADVYSAPDRYYYCPQWALDFNYRGYKIILEILQYQPDVVCFQEVDHFEFFDLELQAFGYHGIYLKRPEGKADGVAIFFKVDKFELIDYQSVDYNKMKITHGLSMSVLSNRYNKNNVGLYSLLLCKSGVNKNKTFAIGNTHLFWDPKFSDVKLRQSHMFLDELQYYLKRKGFSPNETPVIICGDFNSLPTSAVYQLYSNGKVDGNHKDTLQFPSKKEFTHSFTLKSAYSRLNNNSEPITNITPLFSGTLDYIWYSNQLEVTSLVDTIPNDNILKEVKTLGLPTPSISSDHISLISDFQFRKDIKASL